MVQGKCKKWLLYLSSSSPSKMGCIAREILLFNSSEKPTNPPTKIPHYLVTISLQIMRRPSYNPSILVIHNATALLHNSHPLLHQRLLVNRLRTMLVIPAKQHHQWHAKLPEGLFEPFIGEVTTKIIIVPNPGAISTQKAIPAIRSYRCVAINFDSFAEGRN